MHTAIIGLGNMGQYTAQALSPRTDITVFDPNLETEWNHASSLEDAVKNKDVVMFCVPTHIVPECMAQALPHCKKGTLISGQTSRKTPEARAFDLFGDGLEMVTIHTMCNPAKSNPSKEILAIMRHKASDATYNRAMELFSPMSEHIEHFTCSEHDWRTANTQINTSLTYLSIASAFAESGCFPWLNETYNHAIDRWKFDLAMRAASLPGHVYRGIQFGSEHGRDLAQNALMVQEQLGDLIDAGNRTAYRDRILKARDFLFPDGQVLLDEGRVGRANGNYLPNSHFSLIHNAVALAERGSSFKEDMKATTPMFTSLYCLTNYVLLKMLDDSIEAAFDPVLIEEDRVFRNQRRIWSEAMILENQQLYDTRHATMTNKVGDLYCASNGIFVVNMCREATNK